ncbi:MAG: Dabb family protein [Galbitalea sp.]
MIRHVINWKLSAEDQTGKDEAFAAIAAAFAPLPHKIPEIKSLQLGRDLAETPGNWDVVLIIDYESTADPRGLPGASGAREGARGRGRPGQRAGHGRLRAVADRAATVGELVGLAGQASNQDSRSAAPGRAPCPVNVEGRSRSVKDAVSGSLRCPTRATARGAVSTSQSRSKSVTSLSIGMPPVRRLKAAAVFRPYATRRRGVT